METYFDSYFKRMSLVHTELNELGKSLKQLGCEVFVPKNGLIKFIKVFKDDKHLIVGFSEVPYHWYLQICYKPSKENGSGKTIKTK